MSGIEFLKTLDRVIVDRLESGDAESYTVQLASSGGRRAAQKVGEEAVELAIASVDGERGETLAEAADLVYHLLVLLRAQGLSLSDVSRVLESRHTGANVR